MVTRFSQLPEWQETFETFAKQHATQFEPWFLKDFAAMLAFALMRKLPMTHRMTEREEANALIAYCVRNTELEDYHADGRPIGQKEMKVLMVGATRKLQQCLLLKKLTRTKRYLHLYHLAFGAYERSYCHTWEK